ncbi:MAG: histidine kinase, partial [Verrucomicrobiota bacterium]
MHRPRPGEPSLLHLFLGHRLYWLCQIFGWGGLLVIDSVHLLTDPPALPKPSSSFGAAEYLITLAVLSHLYRIFIRLKRWEFLDWNERLPARIAAALAVAVIHVAVYGSLFRSHFWQVGSQLYWHLAFLSLFSFILLLAWSAIYYGYHIDQKYRRIQVNQFRLEAALREAEHRALSAQVNPHFLFNSLNTLRSLIDENPEKARETVTELARLFRASLKTSHNHLITLREELETVRSYLSLEQSRFEERLVIHDDVPEEALEARLPPFLLQTLIENAIKHGDRARVPAEISYRVWLEGRGLKLEVTNSGQIRQRPRDSVTGIGLSNARLRLQLLFGAQAFLNLTAPQDNLVVVEALIPQTGVPA